MELDRRGVLRTAIGVAAAGGLGSATVLGSGAASAAPAAEGAVSDLAVEAASSRPALHHPDLPDVPGMSGDRLANEFWQVFDDATLFNQSPAVQGAFAAMGQYFAQSPPPARNITTRWQEFVRAGSAYPQNFVDYVSPIRQPLQTLSDAQAAVFDQFYHPFDPRLVASFVWFGEGTLYDPRHTPPVHTMGGNPPANYHLWHVFIRGMMFLGIDSQRWARIARLNALAWAVQSVAKPSQSAVNPSLPASVKARLALTWLPKTLEQLDTAFLTMPYPPAS